MDVLELDGSEYDSIFDGETCGLSKPNQISQIRGGEASCQKRRRRRDEDDDDDDPEH